SSWVKSYISNVSCIIGYWAGVSSSLGSLHESITPIFARSSLREDIEQHPSSVAP
ncbi:hypothetical protein KI387_041586, partial [Taxus chinensis]